MHAIFTWYGAHSEVGPERLLQWDTRIQAGVGFAIGGEVNNCGLIAAKGASSGAGISGFSGDAVVSCRSPIAPGQCEDVTILFA